MYKVYINSNSILVFSVIDVNTKLMCKLNYFFDLQRNQGSYVRLMTVSVEALVVQSTTAFNFAFRKSEI